MFCICIWKVFLAFQANVSVSSDDDNSKPTGSGCVSPQKQQQTMYPDHHSPAGYKVKLRRNLRGSTMCGSVPSTNHFRHLLEEELFTAAGITPKAVHEGSTDNGQRTPMTRARIQYIGANTGSQRTRLLDRSSSSRFPETRSWAPSPFQCYHLR
ncbi:uncharacterized protein PG986_005648 [Apiospora aurea]|uniref:Uncharacterized protein n=1 Tax=Apiospora aurea TaxID=335848 RepID=A0ABR1QJK7_9PEZI